MDFSDSDQTAAAQKIHKNIRKTLNGELPGALQPTACKVGTA